MKPGDVFTWKENGTDWLVYLRRLEETAYFRAEIRRCRYTVTIDDTEYKCYVARPSTNEIDWRHQQEKTLEWYWLYITNVYYKRWKNWNVFP